MTKHCKCGHKKGEHWFGTSKWGKALSTCETCHENCCRLRPNATHCNGFEEQKMKRVQDKYGRVCMVVVH